MATQLAREGVASLLPCYPVYGERRPLSQRHHLVCTVAEMGVASSAAAMEGAALTSWATEEFPGVRCCLTGMSMGGACASLSLSPRLCVRESVELVGSVWRWKRPCLQLRCHQPPQTQLHSLSRCGVGETY